MAANTIDVPLSRVWPKDLLNESVAGLFARPGRMILTVLGTVIGLTALVATIGISRTASSRIIGHFDELSATQVTVSVKPTAEPGPTSDLPWDAPARMARLNGVVAAGNVSNLDIGSALTSSSPVSDPQRQTDFKLAVEAASPSLFKTVHARVREGRVLDQGLSDRRERVAVLGPNAADQLGISRLEQLPSIRVGDEVFLVIGVLDKVQREFDLLSAVIIPEGTAQGIYRLRAPSKVIVETRVGAAQLVSDQVRLALKPDNPEALRVASPEEPQRVRNAVQSDLNLLFLMLGGVSLLVGAIGIANVTLVSVMERVGEIGLRRTLGATRWHIAAQFLIESAAMGVLGGLLGASVGMLVVAAVSAYQSWTPVIDPLTPFLAPLIGGAVALLAGAYPAIRAARMDPVEALRAGV